MASTECRAIGCRALLLPYGLFCERCWALVPSDLKRLIEKHHRPRHKPSRTLEKWIAQAMTEVLYIKTEGHPRPQTRTFEWDDPPPATPASEPLPLEKSDG